MTDSRIGRLSETPVASGAPDWALRRALFAGRHEAQLAKRVGVSQFGVNHVILEPGAMSSLRHWHEGEDEFAYVLSGELVLIDETGEHRLVAGDYAGFPAGVANGHHRPTDPMRRRPCWWRGRGCGGPRRSTIRTTRWGR